MKIAVLGASGIIGQSMRLCVPDEVTPIWVRKNSDRLHVGVNLSDSEEVYYFLETVQPDVILNLAGESNTDIVQKNYKLSSAVNTGLPTQLAAWCKENKKHLFHVSTQAVFDGNNPPYHSCSEMAPINQYGKQKAEADSILSGYLCSNNCATIIRLTFILGVRPLPCVGRDNPIEQMLQGQNKQVNDRYFSVLFAREAAKEIWDIILKNKEGIIQLGIPGYASRHVIAEKLGLEVSPARHDDFKGIAPRPINTAYFSNHQYTNEMDEGLLQCCRDWNSNQSIGLECRAREIALFMGISEEKALAQLSKGFHALHSLVGDEYKRNNPISESAILDWYRQTSAYIWELSAYHEMIGFNYKGMCTGIIQALKAKGATSVLVLGDGIGDLTLDLHLNGFIAVYNDLAGSKTTDFANFKFWMHTGERLAQMNNSGWQPEFKGKFDAVVACDILEHLPNVEEWIHAIKDVLIPGGWLFSQNAFNAGSGPSGSIPMHLSCNDHFEKDWDPFLSDVGFRQESSNWYQKI